MASEPDKPTVLKLVSALISPACGARSIVFVGVIDPMNPHVESPYEVRDRILQAASHLPIDQFGTTDDCDSSPFAHDTSTAREASFQKIRARVEGTALANQQLGLS
jgi:5-methyltetrahydropteroyltriglutamate--homocysteine methyltransferase